MLVRGPHVYDRLLALGRGLFFIPPDEAAAIVRERLGVTATSESGRLPIAVEGGNPDTDGDGVPDSSDNCPGDANADQADHGPRRHRRWL